MNLPAVNIHKKLFDFLVNESVGMKKSSDEILKISKKLLKFQQFF